LCLAFQADRSKETGALAPLSKDKPKQARSVAPKLCWDLARGVMRSMTPSDEKGGEDLLKICS
jgi:hypothetical protein